MLSKIKVAKKIYGLVVFSLIGMIVLAAYAGWTNTMSLKQDRERELNSVVETAYALAKRVDAEPLTQAEKLAKWRGEGESIRYVDYREMFAPLASAALGLLVLEIILSCTVFRKIP